ncbi:hypothetical protein D3C81_1871730 [compost metagenome]
MAQGHAQTNGPGQHTNEVGIEQGVDRVVDGAQQQVLQHFTNAARRAQCRLAGAQGQMRREQHAGDNGHHCSREGAQQVQPENWADVGFLAVAMVGD